MVENSNLMFIWKSKNVTLFLILHLFFLYHLLPLQSYQRPSYSTLDVIHFFAYQWSTIVWMFNIPNPMSFEVIYKNTRLESVQSVCVLISKDCASFSNRDSACIVFHIINTTFKFTNILHCVSTIIRFDEFNII